MYLVVSIDTEEDNWGEYDNVTASAENIKVLPVLQSVFDEFSIIPTYLITYPVATNKESMHILRNIYESGKCEIGMHCHPWNTPPFEEERNPYNSMLCNLPYNLQYKKMRMLHETIETSICVNAKSFRAGRWGYGTNTALALEKLGYLVDSSITPFTNWSMDHGPDYSDIKPKPYRFNASQIYREQEKGRLIELPATIGYLQKNFALYHAMERRLTTNWGKILRAKGVLSRMRVLNKVWLSPEASTAQQMIDLTKIFMKRKQEIVNMFFHSTSLKAGLSFIVKRREDEIAFLSRLREYFAFTNDAGIMPVKLSEIASIHLQNGSSHI